MQGACVYSRMFDLHNSVSVKYSSGSVEDVICIRRPFDLELTSYLP